MPTLSAHVIDDLYRRGWATQNAFLPLDLARGLAAECRGMAIRGELRDAGTGHSGTRADIRSDRIAWLSKGETPVRDRYLTIMDNVRVSVNRALFLGLESFETHFAFYAPGACYAPHLDRFREPEGQHSRLQRLDLRVISAVLYLNEAWDPADGGALRLYPQTGPTAEANTDAEANADAATETKANANAAGDANNTFVDIFPEVGRLVLFLSADLLHEVLPARRDRLSLAGWFKLGGQRL